MAKIRFKDKDFRADTLDVIRKANTIINKYTAQGYTLTARQLYYQFVTQNWISNEEKSYKRLTNIISEARLAGLLDWDAIEDRGRQPQAAPHWQNIASLAESAARQFRLPRWDNQHTYVELWVEKQALAGVLWPIAHEHHVTLMVNKGYSSQSAMFDSANRFINSRKRGLLLYLGDFDPSGEDMVRDIRDRFSMFGADDVEVAKIGLTWTQIEEYDPPPNPAKVTDPRAEKYIERHGDESWEVDALPPDVLRSLIEGAIDEVKDHDKWDEVVAREENLKEKFLEVTSDL